MTTARKNHPIVGPPERRLAIFELTKSSNDAKRAHAEHAYLGHKAK